MDISFTAETEQILRIFIIVAGVMVIPVAVALMMVLFKLAFLLHSAQELMTIATHELSPLLKEARLLVTHLESISQQASSGVQGVSNTVQQAGPLFKKSIHSVKQSFLGMIGGLYQSFVKR